LGIGRAKAPTFPNTALKPAGMELGKKSCRLQAGGSDEDKGVEPGVKTTRNRT